ncbi:MAG: hypothetical protein ABSC60_15100 [Acidobacteriota bacterium]
MKVSTTAERSDTPISMDNAEFHIPWMFTGCTGMNKPLHQRSVFSVDQINKTPESGDEEIGRQAINAISLITPLNTVRPDVSTPTADVPSPLRFGQEMFAFPKRLLFTFAFADVVHDYEGANRLPLQYD